MDSIFCPIPRAMTKGESYFKSRSREGVPFVCVVEVSQRKSKSKYLCGRWVELSWAGSLPQATKAGDSSHVETSVPFVHDIMDTLGEEAPGLVA
ncbi:hypothetical protein TNCV_1247871 [Trichonephila clavipes]|nr:hypothetical protein TNCV_1247871 [Trichonephila clavipes]